MKIDFKNLKEKIKNLKPGDTEFVYALAGLVFLVGLFLVIFFGWQYFSGRDFGSAIINFGEDTEEGIEEKCNYRRILDGICVETQSEINPKLVVVMVENHLDSRPQSGLADASIVFEAPVEANYSRFMAIYSAEAKVNKIGPVRSARPYFLDWLDDFGTPLYMHVGGSNEALALIDEYDVFNINEMKRGWYFWRSEDRYAPHNTYTSSRLWEKALETYGDNYGDSEYQSFFFSTSTEFINDFDSELSDAHEITVSFLPPVYEAVWKYNTSTQRYERFQMNKPHLDQDGRQIVADTIVAMQVEKEVIDEVGRLRINTKSSGEAKIFYNGKVVEEEVWWLNKNIGLDRLYFIDALGEPINLKPGKIWIEVVPQDGAIKFN
jgi:hypothetical protein